MLYTRDRVSGAVCLAISLLGLTLASQPASGDSCSPEWVEEVGLPASNRAEVSDFVSYDDGSGMKLYAAGPLDFGPPNERTGALRWNGETWEPLEIQGAGNVATSRILAVYNGQLIAGGIYLIGGQRYSVVRWDTGLEDWVPISNAFVPFAGGFAGDVMVEFDGSLYLGGRHNIDNLGLNSFLFSRYDGTNWGPVANIAGTPDFIEFRDVRDLIVFNDSLYAAFASAIFDGGVVYRLDQDGGAWTKVGGNVPSNSRFAIFQNELYIAGNAGQFDPPVVDKVLRLDSGSWVPIPSSTVYGFTFINALTAADDGSGEALFVGGNIRDIGGVSNVYHVAKWDGSSWSALGGGVSVDNDPEDARVFALYGFNDGSGPALFVGGEFDEVFNNGDALGSRGVAKWSCEPPAVDPVLSEVAADESAITSFGGITRITVTPRDPAGDLLDPGQDVQLFTDAGSLLGVLMDEGDGTYRQDLQATVGPSGANVSAIVNGVALDEVAHVAFVPVDPDLSTIDVSVTQTFVGGSAVVTVTLSDDLGASAGGGFNVQISATIGQLAGAVTDHGDGTYSQTILADATGTAHITATVDGMALNTSTALTVLDPLNIGSIIGFDGDNNPVAFMSIQAAVDAAQDGGTVFVAPGTYEETILIDGAIGITIEGLSAFEPVVIRGIVISDSNDVSLRYLTIDPNGANRPRDAVELRGGNRASSNVEIIGTTITGAAANGVFIGAGNTSVSIIDSTITGNGRYGVETRGGSGPHVISNSSITNNGWTGIELDRNVVITIEYSVITGNGHAFNNGNPNGYGISRGRKGGSGTPEDVTLIQNTLAGNNGRVQNGQSDANLGNYDQMIDATDDQSPYTD